MSAVAGWLARLAVSVGVASAGTLITCGLVEIGSAALWLWLWARSHEDTALDKQTQVYLYLGAAAVGLVLGVGEWNGESQKYRFIE